MLKNLYGNKKRANETSRYIHEKSDDFCFHYSSFRWRVSTLKTLNIKTNLLWGIFRSGSLGEGFNLTYDRSISMLSLLELVITSGFDHEMEVTRAKLTIYFGVDRSEVIWRYILWIFYKNQTSNSYIPTKVNMSRRFYLLLSISKFLQHIHIVNIQE